MLMSMYYLKDIHQQLTRSINTLWAAINPDKKTKKDYVFKDYFNRSIAPKYLDLCLVNRELRNYCCLDMSLERLNTILSLTDEKFKDIEDEDGCISFFEPILDTLLDFKNREGFDSHGTGSIAYRTFPHSTWMSDEDIAVVAAMIAAPKNRPMRILDPDANDGDLLVRFMDALKEKAPSAEIEGYAVDTRGWVSGNRDKFKRVILGEIMGATISHDVFDVVFMPTVNISWEYKYSNLSIVKAERDALKKVTDYLAPGGILVFSLPQGRLYREMCIHLGRYYEDVNVFRNRCDGRECVTVIAHKRDEALRAVEPSTYASLRNIPRHWSSLQFIDMLPRSEVDYIDKMSVPNEEPDLRKFQFRGSKLDEREFARMFQNSPAVAAFNRKQGMNREKELDKHPATPFSVGQLGLIVTSGVANGLIDEGNGRYHAAKSNIIKHTDSDDDLSDDGRRTVVTEKTSNKVEFNVFLADGTAKKLCSA